MRVKEELIMGKLMTWQPHILDVDVFEYQKERKRKLKVFFIRKDSQMSKHSTI